MILLFIQNISPFLVGHIRLMTLKVQKSCRFLNIYQENPGRGWVVLVLGTKKAIISLISLGRIRQTIGKKNSKNRKKTNQRSTSTINNLENICEALAPKLDIIGGKHVLACF